MNYLMKDKGKTNIILHSAKNFIIKHIGYTVDGNQDLVHQNVIHVEQRDSTSVINHILILFVKMTN